MPYDRADRLFEGQSGFQMVTVEPADGTDFRELRDRLAAASNGQFSVYFEAEFAELQTARRGAAQNLATVATIVGIAALVFGGFNLAAISLAERRRDLGIARSVGVSRKALGGLAITRASLLAVAGFVLGGLVAIGALAFTSATTLRSFVFEPEIPPVSWALGAVITITVSAAGSWLAFGSATRSSVKDLLETR
jgi:putative ABC transport system permease protein